MPRWPATPPTTGSWSRPPRSAASGCTRRSSTTRSYGPAAPSRRRCGCSPGARAAILRTVLAGAGVHDLPPGWGAPSHASVGRGGPGRAAGWRCDALIALFDAPLLADAGLVEARVVRKALRAAAEGEPLPLDGLADLVSTGALAAPPAGPPRHLLDGHGGPRSARCRRGSLRRDGRWERGPARLSVRVAAPAVRGAVAARPGCGRARRSRPCRCTPVAGAAAVRHGTDVPALPLACVSSPSGLWRRGGSSAGSQPCGPLPAARSPAPAGRCGQPGTAGYARGPEFAGPAPGSSALGGTRGVHGDPGRRAGDNGPRAVQNPGRHPGGGRPGHRRTPRRRPPARPAHRPRPAARPHRAPRRPSSTRSGAATPPHDAPAALQALVGRLRRTVGKDAVASAPGGYRLAADRGRRRPVPSSSASYGRAPAPWPRATPDRRPHASPTALALWRGPALADLPDRTAATRPEALRLEAPAPRIEADLRLGRAQRRRTGADGADRGAPVRRAAARPAHPRPARRRPRRRRPRRVRDGPPRARGRPRRRPRARTAAPARRLLTRRSRPAPDPHRRRRTTPTRVPARPPCRAHRQPPSPPDLLRRPGARPRRHPLRPAPGPARHAHRAGRLRQDPARRGGRRRRSRRRWLVELAPLDRPGGRPRRRAQRPRPARDRAHDRRAGGPAGRPGRPARRALRPAQPAPDPRQLRARHRRGRRPRRDAPHPLPRAHDPRHQP